MNNIHFHDYEEVLEFIFQQLPIYQRQGPKALKYDLSNITALMEALGNPFHDFKSIHIAGTNGKGSTAHLIAAAFQANGYQTGIYTSPHYIDYRERIKVDGKYIDTDFILDFFNESYQLISKLKPSYFEISVALAFCYFKQKKVDIAIIEVGLGGRLDSTNIITPILSVITNISMDHTQTLGETVELIAGEKAGIIKKGVPVLIGEYQESTTSVFNAIAKEQSAPIYYSKDLDNPLKGLLSDFYKAGPFYKKNVHTAISALQLINKYYPEFRLDQDKIIYGIHHVSTLTKFIGRWQILGNEPLVIVDGAHNIAGWEESLRYLEMANYDHLHLVIGFVSDKSYQQILAQLPSNATYYFCQADIPRALPAGQLKNEGNELGLMGKAYDTVKGGLSAAKTNAAKNDIILVSGSIFVAGEVL